MKRSFAWWGICLAMMAFVAPAIPVVFAQATSSPVQEDSDPDGRSLKRELDTRMGEW